MTQHTNDGRNRQNLVYPQPDERMISRLVEAAAALPRPTSRIYQGDLIEPVLGSTMSDEPILFRDEDLIDCTPGCPACGGEPTPLGTLGNLDWHRCRACGIDYHTEVRLTPEEEL